MRANTLSFLAVVVIYFVIAHFMPRDNTDPPGGRSGMTIRVDHLTGCEYLSDWGLTPRLGQDGKQICKKDAQ
jgi:hypothetical protein